MASSYVSFFIIAATVCFWIYLILKITVFRYLKIKRSADDAEKGRPISGTVVSVSKTKRGRFQSIKMKIEFLNFSQTLIQEEFRLIDTKPEENRYEQGKKVMLLIDDIAKGGPAIKIAGGKTVIGKPFMLISAILLSGVFYGAWFIYKLTLSKINNDWSRIDELFAKNEAMPSIGIIFLGILVFEWFIFRTIVRIGSSKKKVNDRELKFYGEKTIATINKYEDTGVSINNNPKVKFFYTFTDRNGRQHSSEDAKVIGKLEIGYLPSMNEIEIFYMPQNPENSKFTENLAPQSFVGCINLVLILQAAVFSGILIGLYLSMLP